jgi:hypothetical protein
MHVYFLSSRRGLRPPGWRVWCPCGWEKITATKGEARTLGNRHLASVAPVGGRR